MPAPGDYALAMVLLQHFGRERQRRIQRYIDLIAEHWIKSVRYYREEDEVFYVGSLTGVEWTPELFEEGVEDGEAQVVRKACEKVVAMGHDHLLHKYKHRWKCGLGKSSKYKTLLGDSDRSAGHCDGNQAAAPS